MATLEMRGKEKYRLVFWYQGKRYQGAVKANKQSKAEELRRRVEGNLELLEQGRLEYRPGDDLLTLMLSDGKINAKPTVSRRVTVGEFFDEFLDEASNLCTIHETRPLVCRLLDCEGEGREQLIELGVIRREDQST